MQQDIRLFLSKTVNCDDGRVEYPKCGTAEPVETINRVGLEERHDYEGGAAEPDNPVDCDRTEPARTVPECGDKETECGRNEQATNGTECGRNAYKTRLAEHNMGQSEPTECGQETVGHSEYQEVSTECGRAESTEC